MPRFLETVKVNGATAVTLGGDVSISRTAANTVALATGDKMQSDVLAIAGNDYTNQVYVDRLIMFHA